MSHDAVKSLPVDDGPSLAKRGCVAGMIVESWRLWEGISDSIDADIQRISDWRLDSDYFELKGGSGGVVAAVIAQGAPIAVDAVERLRGSGASAIVRLGTTGGLQETQSVGDLVVPYCGIRDEGVSGFYLPASMPAVASFELTLEICAALSTVFGTDIKPSIVWTTDGRWCESDQAIRKFSELSIAAVDMESAAIFAAGYKRKVSVASVSLIADLPILHLGHEYKGLPDLESNWSEKVVVNARRIVNPLLTVLSRWANV